MSYTFLINFYRTIYGYYRSAMNWLTLRYGPFLFVYSFNGKIVYNSTLRHFLGQYLSFLKPSCLYVTYLQLITAYKTHRIAYYGGDDHVNTINQMLIEPVAQPLEQVATEEPTEATDPDSNSDSDSDSDSYSDEIQRDEILFFHEKEPIQFNLNVLDDYYRTVKKFEREKNFKPLLVSKMDIICKVLGIHNVTHVQITKMIPFSKKLRDIGDTNIEMLYR